MVSLGNNTRKTLIALAGWSVLLLGMVMIPYPGPGWVVVFIGLSILATEFKWASDLHDYAHGKYHAWLTWQSVQPFYVKAIFWVLTFMTVIITVWLVNGYGIMSAWLGLEYSWLESPFIR
ncbi:TIGR02611 family protein [Candidatus Saccharibacteria bacterium]|nr:TIGR02611 family protein [Candidatus Saccharibacteria bacterium]